MPPAIRTFSKGAGPILKQIYSRPATTATRAGTAHGFTPSPPSPTLRNATPKRLQSTATEKPATSGLQRPPSPNIESLSHDKQPSTDETVKSTSSSSPSPTTTATSSHDLASPLHLPTWLQSNSHLLQPPIGNHCVTNSSMTIMIVGGPNARTDYHINSTPEFFYQYEGDMVLKAVEPPSTGTEKETFKDITIKEGSLYLLPPNIPHSPQRFANTVGIVVELPRPEGAKDALRWYCQGCGSRVHERSFECVDLGTQIKRAVQDFENDLGLRRCGKCGEIADVKPK